MIVAVASGKGGTGKTTVSASLASTWPSPVVAVDLDVEEPNLHLFLKPDIRRQEAAHIEVPEIDEGLCTRCRACSDLCQFKAIGIFGDVVMTFPEMCHGCSACWTICPEGAISPGRRELGQILTGRAGRIAFCMGRLRVGEAMSPPLMREVKHLLAADRTLAGHDVIIDAPPGVSCPAINAVMDADVIVLVTEPTPFGLYDLDLACKAFANLNKPMGVVINRSDIGTRGVEDFCRQAGLPVLARIPFQRDIAAAYAQGRIIAEAVPAVRPVFDTLRERIVTLARRNAVPREVSHA
jgi:MinD superfamily P-loop ATPase